MVMALNIARGSARGRRSMDEEDSQRILYIDSQCHPYIAAVLQTRSRPLGIQLKWFSPDEKKGKEKPFEAGTFAQLLSYPNTLGEVKDYSSLVQSAQKQGLLTIVSCDLLSLCLLTPPGEWGADIVIGNSQRFGVPMNFGGPHAAFFACRKEFKRQLPGRLVGVSVDRKNKKALRLSLQTREQHIRRERATSNICTSQVLLANMASAYAIYHGPHGLREIAGRVHALAQGFAQEIKNLGYSLYSDSFFDTLVFRCSEEEIKRVEQLCKKQKFLLRFFKKGLLAPAVGLSFNETSTPQVCQRLLSLLAQAREKTSSATASASTSTSTSATASASASTSASTTAFASVSASVSTPAFPAFSADFAQPPSFSFPSELCRESSYLQAPAFNIYHSETKMMRYLYYLQQKDISLVHSMIPLGSCTMKLNSAAELSAVFLA